MISRYMEQEIRRIVRDEIAQDEQRRIEHEREGAQFARRTDYVLQPGGTLLDFNPDRLEALDKGAGA